MHGGSLLVISERTILGWPHLREVELERIICAQADVQPHLKEVGKGVALVGQEEGVIAKGTHGEPDLLQIE